MCVAYVSIGIVFIYDENITMKISFHFEIKAPQFRVYTCENWSKPKTFITSFFVYFSFDSLVSCSSIQMNKRGKENDEKEKRKKIIYHSLLIVHVMFSFRFFLGEFDPKNSVSFCVLNARSFSITFSDFFFNFQEKTTFSIP